MRNWFIVLIINCFNKLSPYQHNLETNLDILSKDVHNLISISTTKNIEMREQRIQISDRQALFPALFERIFCIVCLVKSGIKTAKEFTHCNIHFAVTIICSRVENCSLAVNSSSKISGPQIAVQCSRRLLRKINFCAIYYFL